MFRTFYDASAEEDITNKQGIEGSLANFTILPTETCPFKRKDICIRLEDVASSEMVSQ